MARGAELQPVDLKRLGGEDGQVVLGGQRRGARRKLREWGTGRSGRECAAARDEGGARDGDQVREKVADLARDADLSRFIL